MCVCGLGTHRHRRSEDRNLQVANAALYCPKARDLTVAYTVPGDDLRIYDGGWFIRGGGAVATKAAYNLLGGYVEYTVNFTNVRLGVNANIYTISPWIGGEFTQNNYCDGAATGSKWCPEVDWVESNGNCGGASTLHTREGPGSDGCTAWGCSSSYNYGGNAIVKMRIDYDDQGKWTTTWNGNVISPWNLNPGPQDHDWQVLADAYRQKGAVIYSSIWVGWVPGPGGCGTNPGDLSASYYDIHDLKISGTVKQGPEPAYC